MARRLRITALAAAALGPEAVALLRRDLRVEVGDDAGHLDYVPAPVLRVASERLDQPRALPAA